MGWGIYFVRFRVMTLPPHDADEVASKLLDELRETLILSREFSRQLVDWADELLRRPLLSDS